MNAELIMLICGVAAFVWTIYWVRIRHLREKYALVWLLFAAAALFFGMFPQIIIWFAAQNGLSNSAAALLVFAVAMYFFSFSVSVSLSRQYRRNLRLTQELAILEERVRRLEKSAGSPLYRTEPHSPRPTRPDAPPELQYS